MPIYRGTTPLKAYKGDMQPVNVYDGGTKAAGWHSASYSGTSPLAVDCDYDVPPDALVVDGKCMQNTTTGKNLLPRLNDVGGYKYTNNGITYTVDGDGAVTANGTCSGGTSTFVRSFANGTAVFAAGTYSLSQNNFSMNTRTIQFYMHFSVINKYNYGTFTLPSQASLLSIMYYVQVGVTLSNVKLYPQLEIGSAATSYEPYTGGIPSPNPSYPQPISTITGDMTITGADGTASDTVTVALGGNVCASLPDGTHDSYDAVSGVLTKRVGKYSGASGTSWTISDASTSSSFMSDMIPAGTLIGQTVTASAACAPTIYYKLATPTTVQLTSQLPVVHSGIKTLTVGADVVPNLSATVKSMD